VLGHRRFRSGFERLLGCSIYLLFGPDPFRHYFDILRRFAGPTFAMSRGAHDALGAAGSIALLGGLLDASDVVVPVYDFDNLNLDAVSTQRKAVPLEKCVRLT